MSAVAGARAGFPGKEGGWAGPAEETPWCLVADTGKAKSFCGKIKDGSDCSPYS